MNPVKWFGILLESILVLIWDPVVNLMEIFYECFREHQESFVSVLETFKASVRFHDKFIFNKRNFLGT